MKIPTILLTLCLGVFFIAPEVGARGQKHGGGSRASAPKRSSPPPKRSPMSSSRVQRPQARLQPKPVARLQPASRPAARPEARPAKLPAQRPALQKPSVQKPSARPEARPANLPDRPGNNRPNVDRPNAGRPGNDRPMAGRPDSRPSLERPGQNKPATLPGMVSYPNRPDKGRPVNRPNVGDRNNVNAGNRLNTGGNRLNAGGNRVNIDNSRDRNRIDHSRNVHIDKVNVGRRNVALNRPGTRPAGNRNWDANKWGGGKSVWGNRANIGNNVNVNIDNNFRRNNNFSYRPNYWGARPWWGANNSHNWHHGHWNYGWNSNYYRRHWYYNDDDFASGFMWGITVWSLGNLVYDMGYQSYKNPYPAPAVQNTYVNYSQPVSVAAAANPPGDDATAEIAEAKSDEALERSRAAFKAGDYVGASKAVDEAIGHTPGDVTLHEYRSLVFFALGKYADAAGVLNPVLASGPGWGWDTMIGFYDAAATYSGQLRKLEAYVKGQPDAADGRFLLGYHYMVCGFMDKAYQEFSKAAELQPGDGISRQLRDLTKSSVPDDGDAEAEPPARPAPVPADKLVGTWVSDRGADGRVTFTMTEDGSYTWAFMNGDKSSELKGTYGLDDKGLLVLTSDDTQMVSVIEMKEDTSLHFMLVGAPDGDPGLNFKKG
jgi:tetratricopeptide (TPR) repeat protein